MPFLSIYTPTFRRPQRLARCLASVQRQTAVAEIEQFVAVDHVGVGVPGMYAAVPAYAPALHGDYVTFLCDDDLLASSDVVARVKAFAAEQGMPPLILVATRKGAATYPIGRVWPPVECEIDLNCAIVRRDIWQQYAWAYSAKGRYEGDFDFLEALHKGGIPAVWCPLLFSVGDVSRGVADELPTAMDCGADIPGGGAA